jgi:hypothetical protein
VSFFLIADLESPLLSVVELVVTHHVLKVFMLSRPFPYPSLFVYTSHPPVRSHTRLDRYSSSYTTKYRKSIASNTAAFHIASPRPAPNTEIGQPPMAG